MSFLSGKSSQVHYLSVSGVFLWLLLLFLNSLDHLWGKTLRLSEMVIFCAFCVSVTDPGLSHRGDQGRERTLQELCVGFPGS